MQDINISFNSREISNFSSSLYLSLWFYKMHPLQLSAWLFLTCMYPIVTPLITGVVCTALGFLIFVMRKKQVDTTRMEVYLWAKDMTAKIKKGGENHYLIYFDTCSCLKVMKDFMHTYIRTSCIKFQNAKQVFPKHRIPFYLAIAEHSMCHPGLPWPQGESQKGSPGLTPFHRAKSRAFFFRLSFGRSVIFGSGTIFPYLP